MIVRDEEGQILLLCKGADRLANIKKVILKFCFCPFNFIKFCPVFFFFCSIIFDRLAKNGKTYLGPTTRHLTEYGEAGLRTLALAYRRLDEEEYTAWNTEFLKAKTSIGSDRDELLEKGSDMIEKELILVGATAVEDKLQKGVCIIKQKHLNILLSCLCELMFFLFVCFHLS